MLKRIVFGIMLTLLLTSMLTLAFDIQQIQVSGSRTIEALMPSSIGLSDPLETVLGDWRFDARARWNV